MNKKRKIKKVIEREKVGHLMYGMYAYLNDELVGGNAHVERVRLRPALSANARDVRKCQLNNIKYLSHIFILIS